MQTLSLSAFCGADQDYADNPQTRIRMIVCGGPFYLANMSDCNLPNNNNNFDTFTISYYFMFYR